MIVDKYRIVSIYRNNISNFYEKVHTRWIMNLVVSEHGVWEKWAQPNIR